MSLRSPFTILTVYFVITLTYMISSNRELFGTTANRQKSFGGKFKYLTILNLVTLNPQIK